MPVLYSAGGENCFRRSCRTWQRRIFVNAASRRGATWNIPLRKSEKTSKLRRSGAPTFKTMVGMGDKKEGADAEKHVGTRRKYRKHKKRRKSTEKRRKSTEKARKKKKVYGLRKEGGGRGDKIAVRGGENALNTKGKSYPFQVLFWRFRRHSVLLLL